MLTEVTHDRIGGEATIVKRTFMRRLGLVYAFDTDFAVASAQTRQAAIK